MSSSRAVMSEPEEQIYQDSEHAYYDYNAAAGFPIWLDKQTLTNLFSFRYDSQVFNNEYMQEEYRQAIHRQSSALIRRLIKIRVGAEQAKMQGTMIPDDGKDDEDSLYDERIIGKNNVLEIAREMGMDPEKIPVSTIMYDVTNSLLDLMSEYIRERPGMSPEEKEASIGFMTDQLYDETAQRVWKCVHADTLADLYSYEELPDGIIIITDMNDYALDDLEHGMHQAMDIRNVNMEEVLSDNMVHYVMDTVKENREEKRPLPTEWAVQNALADIENGDY